MSETDADKQETCNHTTPVIFSPLFDWPPNFKGAFLTLTKRWVTLSRNVLFLLLAWLVYSQLTPEPAALKDLHPGWMGAILLRNYLLMTVIAGGLHLCLFTYRRQGRQLKYDHREQLEQSGKFSFRNQVWDNVFWTLVSGTTIWSLYEVAYFWGVANGVIGTVTLADHPVAFVLWLLVLPVLTSSHFYFIHRLLHWPPLYKTVHRLHHCNIHSRI